MSESSVWTHKAQFIEKFEICFKTLQAVGRMPAKELDKVRYVTSPNHLPNIIGMGRRSI